MTDTACLERDLAAYACADVLIALQETGQLPIESTAHEVIARYRAAVTELEAASGVRQILQEVPA